LAGRFLNYYFPTSGERLRRDAGGREVSAGAFFESLQALLGMATHPSADGAQVGVEEANCGLQTVLAGEANQTQSMAKRFFISRIRS